jgi:hypothetical protein
MQAIFIHDTETEEIVGLVSPIEKVDFDKFQDEVYTSWVSFNSNEHNVTDYTIEDFVDFHNLNSNIKIDWVLTDYIQL